MRFTTVIVIGLLAGGWGWTQVKEASTGGSALLLSVRAAEVGRAGRAFTNRLAGEKSPYLLQHARNPVDWYPWGEEAFAKARRENKPIFLSVGYSTCHWCHVMERESFEDPATAAVMNEHFVNVKVDREERPDVDRVYMTFVQAATGSGGWPMNVWLTPDLKPFAGGTYFPSEAMAGRTSFKSALRTIAEAWAKEREKVLATSDAILAQLRDITAPETGLAKSFDTNLLQAAYHEIKAAYDPVEGGFGKAPKFPRPVTFNFLLRHWARTRSPEALEMTLFTLRKMAGGGIHDHLGGGFHRYSVDNRWHVPHFEKMLYDQAQLAISYVEAFQASGDPFFAQVARDVFDYVRRDMTGPEGQFYSAEDADSPVPGDEKKQAEGAFYVWEDKEIEKVLGKESAALFAFHYGVGLEGNVKDDPHGEFANKNILIVSHTMAETAARFMKSQEETAKILAQSRQKLFRHRVRRPRPHLDDKTLTGWNGLMISAFARGYQVLEKREYLDAARRAADFLRKHLQAGVSEGKPEEGNPARLLRRHRAGAAGIEAYLDDYTYLIQGLLDLYEAGFNPSDLEWALGLQKTQDELFWDKAKGGYFTTTGSDPNILLRMKEDYDGAEPSPNSIALLNLLRISEMTGRKEPRERAERIMAALSKRLEETPSSAPQAVAAAGFYLHKPKQIVIAGPIADARTRSLLRIVHEKFRPDKIVLLVDGGAGQTALARSVEFIKPMKMLEAKPTAYVCRDYVCELPTSDPDVFRKLLDH